MNNRMPTAKSEKPVACGVSEHMVLCTVPKHASKEQIVSLKCMIGESLFPLKLHMLVSSPIITQLFWSPDGKAFLVDRSGYEKHIMNEFFDHNKFTSFQKLLHKYQFHRESSYFDFDSMNRKIDLIEYSHEYFIKGQPELAVQVQRT